MSDLNVSQHILQIGKYPQKEKSHPSIRSFLLPTSNCNSDLNLSGEGISNKNTCEFLGSWSELVHASEITDIILFTGGHKQGSRSYVEGQLRNSSVIKEILHQFYSKLSSSGDNAIRFKAENMHLITRRHMKRGVTR